MKRVMAVILAFSMLIGTFVYLGAQGQAQAASNPIGAQVSDWVLDESNHFIYAVSQADKKLLFISSDTLQVDYTLSFDTAPTDIDLYNGKLYIPLEMDKQIKVIDVTAIQASAPASASLSASESPDAAAAQSASESPDAAFPFVVETISTANYPIRTAITGDKLFYTSSNYIQSYEQWDSLNLYNLSTQTEQKIYGTNDPDYNYIKYQYYCPDIVVSPTSNVLYIGESRISAARILALSTDSLTIIDSNTPIYFSGNFTYPDRIVLCNDENVYFSANALNPKNLSELKGTYSTLKSGYYHKPVICSKGNIVITSDAIYDRDTYKKLYILPFEASLATIDDAGNVYYLVGQTVYRYSDALPYVQSLEISGNNQVTIPTAGTTTSFYTALIMDQYGQTMTNAVVTWSIEPAVTGVTIDSDGVVTVDSTAAPGSAFSINAVSGSMSATLPVELTKSDQSAPTGLTAVGPTSDTSNDGEILGVTEDMEYRSSNAAEYTRVTGTSITGLAPGTYYVRYAAKDGYDASPDAIVVISRLTVRDALKSAINTAEMYLNGTYVYTNHVYLQTAYENAVSLLNNPAVADGDLAAALAALTDENHRCYLEDLVTTADSKSESDYTKVRWTALQEAKVAAQDIFNNRAATTVMINNAVANMNLVLAALPLLDELIEIVQGFSQENCTAKTWSAIQADLPKALEMQADPYWRYYEVSASDECLLTDVFAYQLDWSIGFAHMLVGYGDINYSDAVWIELNAAYAEGLSVQTKEAPTLIELANAYTRLDAANQRAVSEYLVKYAGNLQKTNVIAEDWNNMQSSLLAVSDLLQSGSTTADQLYTASRTLISSYRTIFAKAPIGLAGIAPTTAANEDGKITGTTVLMEYRLYTVDNSAAWTASPGAEISALTPGRYQVRYGANEISANPGAAATIEVRDFTAADGTELKALQALVDDAAKYVGSSHDYVNTAYLNSAYEQAQTVLKNADAALADIQSASDALNAEILRCQLEDQLVICYSSDQDDYTSEQWQALMTAKRAAEDVIFDRNAAVSDITREIDSMTAALAQDNHQKPVSKAALQALADNAMKYVGSSHDYVNTAYLNSAYEQAQTVLNNADATSDDVQSATDALNAEILRCQLEDLLVICYTSDPDDYTSEQWQALMTAKRAAEDVIFDRNAAVSDITREIDSMTAALAQDNHQEPVSKAALQALADNAMKYVGSSHDYVNATNLNSAYEQAQTVLNNADATSDDVQSATDALNEEILRCQLEDLLVICYTSDPDDYTSEHWQALMTAKRAAEDVIFDRNAAVGDITREIDSMTAALAPD